MKSKATLALPPSPNLIVALRSGFDTITTHISLILFPVALDLLLWLGPQLRLTRLVNSFLGQLASLPGLQEQGMGEFLKTSTDLWKQLATQLNLLVALRSYPVGIPSLMVSRLPNETPFGLAQSWEIGSALGVFLTWIVFTFIGLLAGALFFSLVSQAALTGEIHWRQALRQWIWAAGQVLFLALLWAALFMGASLPGSLVLSLAAFGGLSIAQCGLLLYIIFLFWLLLPLLFSPHGIFVNQNNTFNSIKMSARLTRQTMPTSALFFLMVVVLSKGLDVLWLAPKENSWLILVGIAGHAFITTGLLASSFIYYRDADRWASKVLTQKKLSAI
ncbi:MAG TPA: hypothetical protein VJ436_03475 [Anaerolineales bacterium]|nr:hypothetical protein [Anaerolineales bacterium]